MEEKVVDPVLAGFLASLAAGLATAVGAFPVLVIKKASDRLLDALLGFAAGVMIAASMFGLLVPSFRLGGVPITLLGFFFGVVFLDGANMLIPHWHRLRGLEAQRHQSVESGSCCWRSAFTIFLKVSRSG